jgi:hypothetical protein
LKFDEAEAGKQAMEGEKVHEEADKSAQQTFDGDRDLQADFKFIMDILDDVYVTDSEALTILDRIKKYLPQPEKMRSLAVQMDKTEALDRLIGEIPAAALFEEVSDKRKALLLLLSFRPAYKNLRLAREFVSYSFTDWLIDDEEAFLAFQLVKALPAASRKVFIDAEGGKYRKRTEDEMTQKMREAETMNFYMGGKNRHDKASIQGQLSEDSVWTEEKRISELDGLIRMAIAAGEREWVFNESKRRVEQNKQTLPSHIVEKYLLYNPKAVDKNGNPAPRTTYQPTQIEGTTIWQEGVFSYLNTFGQLIDFLVSSRKIRIEALFKGTGFGLNLFELQDVLGGSLGGVRLKKFEDLGEEGAKAKQSKSGVNFADAKWDLDGTKVLMRANDLAIAAVNLFIGDLKFQAGESKVTGMSARVIYPDSKDVDLVFAEVFVGRVIFNDVLLVNPDGMTAINRVEVRSLHVQAGDKRPADSPLVLGVANLLEPKFPLPFNITVGLIDLEGVTTSGGQHVERLTIKDVAIRGGETLAAYKAALDLSRKALLKRLSDEKTKLESLPSTEEAAQERATLESSITQLTGQLTSVDREIETVARDIQELLALEAKKKAAPDGRLRDEEEKRLEKLRGKGGMALDVGSVDVSGVTGTLSAKSLGLKNIHGHGRSTMAVLGLVSDSEQLKKYVKGTDALPVVKGADAEEASFQLQIGNFKATELNVQGSIPSPEVLDLEVRRVVEKLKIRPQDTRLLRELTRLTQLYAAAKEYEQLASRGVTYLNTEERKRFMELRRQFLGKSSFKAGEISLESAVLDLTKEGRSISASAGKVDAKAVTVGGIFVGEAHGKNVRGGVELDRGLAALLDLRKHIKEGERFDTGKHIKKVEAGADELKLTDVRYDSMGLHIDEIAVGEMGASLEANAGDSKARLKAKKIAITGINLIAFRALLQSQLAKMPNPPVTELSEDERKKLELNHQLLIRLQEILDKLDVALRDLADLKGTSQEPEAQKAVDTIINSISIDDLDIMVSGLGDVLSEDYNFEAAMKDGVDVAGMGGENQDQFFSGATFGGGKHGDLTLPQVKLGAVTGKISFKDPVVTVTNFGIASVTIAPITYTTPGGSTIKSTGPTVFEKIVINGTVTLAKNQQGETLLKPESIHISEARVQTITGTGLEYENKKDQTKVVVESGSLAGVWLREFDINLPKNADDPVEWGGKVGATGPSIIKAHGALAGGLKASAELNIQDISLEIAGKGNTTTIRGLQVKDIIVPRFNFKSGTMEIDSGEKTVFHGIKADVSIVNGKKDLESVDVDLLHIDKIDSRHIVYKEDNKILLDARKPKPEKGERDTEIEIIDVNLRKFQWKPKQGITRGSLDVKTFAADFKATFDKINLDVTIAGGGLSLKFKKGGQIEASLKHLKAEVSGDVDGTKVSILLETGQVEGDPNRPAALKTNIEIKDDKLTLSDFIIDLLEIKRLSVDDKDIGITVPASTGSIKLNKINLGLVVNFKPKPKKGEKPRPKDESSIESIVVNKLDIPTITGKGIQVDLKNYDVKLVVPSTQEATLSGVSLFKPATGGASEFVAKPKKGGGWNLEGGFTVNAGSVAKLGAEVIGAVKATTDLKAEKFDIQWFSDGKMKVDLKKINLEQISADILSSKGTATIKMIPGLSKHGGAVPGASIEGFHLEKKGDDVDIKVDKAGVSGLVFDDRSMGVKIDIKDATLPSGLTRPPGKPWSVPDLDINEAYFKIDDLSKLLKLSPPGTGAALVRSDVAFLDNLDGSVDVGVRLHLDLPIGKTQQMEIATVIKKGIVKYKDLTRHAPVLMEWTKSKNGLLLEIDLGMVLPDPNVAEWDLDPKDKAAGKDEVTVPTLITPKPSGKSRLKSVEIIHLNTDLNLLGTSVFHVAPSGTVTLGGAGKDGITHLKATLASKAAPSSHLKVPIDLTMDEANIQLENIELHPRVALNVGGPPATIQINNVHDTQVSFSSWSRPSVVEGTIGKAKAKNIFVHVAPAPKKATP